MNLGYIFSQEYLFQAVPNGKDRFFIPFLVLFGFLLVFSIAIRFLKNVDENIRFTQSNCYFVVGLLGLVYVFSRQVGLPWLASRAYLCLVFMMLIIWLLYLIIWMAKYLSEMSMKTKTASRYEKYLPQPKKR